MEVNNLFHLVYNLIHNTAYTYKKQTSSTSQLGGNKSK